MSRHAVHTLHTKHVAGAGRQCHAELWQALGGLAWPVHATRAAGRARALFALAAWLMGAGGGCCVACLQASRGGRSAAWACDLLITLLVHVVRSLASPLPLRTAVLHSAAHLGITCLCAACACLWVRPSWQLGFSQLAEAQHHGSSGGVPATPCACPS